MNLEIKQFNDLVKIKTIKSENVIATPKVAILSDSSSQFISKAIISTGFLNGFNYEIFEADHNQIEQNIFDKNSDLYTFKPEFIIILYSAEKLLHQFYKNSKIEPENFAKNRILEITNLIETINSNINTKIIFSTFFELNDSVYGNFSTKISGSFRFQVKSLNYNLFLLSQQINNLFLLDIESIINQFGYHHSYDAKMYINFDLNFNLDIIPVIANNIHQIIKTQKGFFVKCIILDLDNTMWGGIIGDDGIENIKIGNLGIGKAFTDFQYWLKSLKDRGIILCVCSKNNDDIAKDVFIKHPEMVLKLEDFAVFVANWNTKVDNIFFIQSILNINFDSIVFLDDNSFEREMVISAIPNLIVPSLPKEPENYITYLRSLNLFETSSFTNNDTVRTQQYQEESKRAIFKLEYNDENDYLKSLQMTASFEHFNNFIIPRISQLSQRSNQFNLRTIRLNNNELESIVNDSRYITFSLSLKDKFGDYGLVCFLILEVLDSNSLYIHSWVMSCRVLKRGVENFIMENLLNYAKNNSYSRIIGEYIPTPKNKIVSDLYLNLGFVKTKDCKWEFSISMENNFKDNFITLKNNNSK